MGFGPYTITIARLIPTAYEEPQKTSRPYQCGVWRMPDNLRLNDRLEIHCHLFNQPPPKTFVSSAGHFTVSGWNANLGTIVRKEKTRIWTEAALDNDEFLELKRLAALGFEDPLRATILYVNNKSRCLTFRYTPAELPKPLHFLIQAEQSRSA